MRRWRLARVLQRDFRPSAEAQLRRWPWPFTYKYRSHRSRRWGSQTCE
jgi:hypothetical protein